MSYEKERVTTKENREKGDDEERSVELDNDFYDTDIITTTTDIIIKVRILTSCRYLIHFCILFLE